MPTIHRVKQGECLSSIAAAHGFADWRAIYQDAANAALRATRPNPNVLHPGDELTIPDKAPKSVSVDTDRRHRFVMKQALPRLRLQLCNGSGRPFIGKRYVLNVGGAVLEGTTDGDGMVDQPVPAGEARAELVVWPSDGAKAGCRFELALGELDPVEEPSGLAARLANLGFAGATTDDLDGTLTDAALRRFQRSHGLEVTGQPDAATLDALRQRHDE